MLLCVSGAQQILVRKGRLKPGADSALTGVKLQISCFANLRSDQCNAISLWNFSFPVSQTWVLTNAMQVDRGGGGLKRLFRKRPTKGRRQDWDWAMLLLLDLLLLLEQILVRIKNTIQHVQLTSWLISVPDSAALGHVTPWLASFCKITWKIKLY